MRQLHIAVRMQATLRERHNVIDMPLLVTLNGITTNPADAHIAIEHNTGIYYFHERRFLASATGKGTLPPHSARFVGISQRPLSSTFNSF